MNFHSPSQEIAKQSVAAPANAQPGQSNVWQRAESKISTIHSQEDTDGFLKDARISNFNEQLDSSLMGCFEGDINFQDGSGKSWQMEMENVALAGKDQPHRTIQLFENGKRFSMTKGDGPLDDFRKFAGGESSAVFIQANPKDYLQLYYLSDRDSYIGNLYEKSSTTRYQAKGTLSLTRRACPIPN